MDPPAIRVKPLPFTIISHTYTNALTPMDTVLADMAILGFFFLLRPGEHTASSQHGDTQPFRLCDVTFRVGAVTTSAATGGLDLIPHATFVTLTFSKQKNARENEIVGHARSGHNSICPVLAAIRRTMYLRQHLATPTTPLCTWYPTDRDALPTPLKADQLTTLLRHSATALFPVLGFDPRDISARSLRAGGAMSLLCAQVDSNVIKLVGRWRSDEMLQYLHLQAYPQMHSFARLMTQGGNFRLLHNLDVPAAAVPLLALAPEDPTTL